MSAAQLAAPLISAHGGGQQTRKPAAGSRHGVGKGNGQGNREVTFARRAPSIQINVPAIYPNALPPNITQAEEGAQKVGEGLLVRMKGPAKRTAERSAWGTGFQSRAQRGEDEPVTVPECRPHSAEEAYREPARC